jgi:DNA polymerase-3 subunit delta'
VELVRQNGARFHLHTADGGWRIAIVDCLNDLNPSSANALLKLLEEPPNKSLFLLINHTGGFVLPTLRSRCLALTLNPLSEDDLAAVIGQTGDTGPEALPLIHRLAGGSAGRALEMAAADGPGLYRAMIGLLAGLPDRDDEKLHKLATKLSRNRESPEYQTFVALLQDWLAKTAQLAARQGQTGDQAFIPEEADMLNRFVAMPGVDRWVGVWEKIVELFRRTEIRNLDRKQTLLDAFFYLQQAVRA